MAFRWVFLLAVATSISLASQGGQPPVTPPQGTPPRDVAKERSATAVIRGKVVAAGTGQPLHRVQVTLNGTTANPPTAVTDTRGVFELTAVPAGTFTITAVRAGYLPLHYGQRRPREAGRTLRVASGDVVEGIEIALSRGGVLAGRVTDDLGEPIQGTRVEAVEFRYINGRRVAVPARIATTNDIGEYRLANLEPGTYQVRASTREMWESDDGQATFAYAVTYYPGVTAADRPPAIEVAVAQQVTGLDFALVPGRAARITGVVEDAEGARPSGQIVHLSEIARTIGGALLSSGPGGTTKTDSAGAFEFPKLPPGEYLAYAGGPNERAAETVVVHAGDARHVVLTVRRPAAARGSIVTDEGKAPPFPAARVRVLPIAVDAENVLPLWGAPREGLPKADWTFQVPNADGQYLFRISGLPDEWTLKEVVLGSRVVTDTAVAVRHGGADVEGLRMVLTRDAARLTGDVVDRDGAAAPDSTVVVFAEDRARWGIGSRFIRAVRPDGKGHFSVGALPPGVYRVVARDWVPEGQWEDPEFLESVFKRAARIEIAQGATGTVTLIQESGR